MAHIRSQASIAICNHPEKNAICEASLLTDEDINGRSRYSNLCDVK